MFKKGQLVVAIRKHPLGQFAKGEIFTVQSVRRASCDCMECIVDIGKESYKAVHFCGDCNIPLAPKSITYWFSNRYFAPADPSFARRILEKIENELNS